MPRPGVAPPSQKEHSTTKQFDTINPATEETIATHRYLEDSALEARIEACHAAFRDWRLKSHAERGKIIQAIGEVLRARKDELAALMTREMGKLLGQSEQEIALCAAICDYTAEQGPDVLAPEDREIAHSRIRDVTLTGSPDAGREIAQKAGKELKKTVLELNFNDAYLVLSDADVQKAARICVTGRIYNNGKTCVAAKRFIVADAVYDVFKDASVAAIKGLKPGDPTNGKSDIGPVAPKDLRDDPHEQVQQSVAKGAEILFGGGLPESEGHYYPATVLGNVKPGQPAYDDELFGPVAALIHAKDDEDAMRIANDSKFGLGSGIISQNVQRAVELAETEFDTGMIFINGFGLATPNMPFGGVKDSGYGREHGGFGMLEITNTKAVLVMDE
ncbi:aldehyde dehydrogenase family protein [Sulfitobacter aestuarii]|uniref:Aldehyde dehydrogenase family protein n=1 Tax=Sulfitobacter aestuarii TaxID=2161676 RepID=A0ABW5U4W3_9RHOB